MHKLPGYHTVPIAIAIAMVSLVWLGTPVVGQERDIPNASDDEFPRELVNFKPYEGNPVFSGTGTDTWDRAIRERGYIMREEGTYYLWYTGYRGASADTKFIGLATSSDGIHWTRDAANPVFAQSWVEDMCVVKWDGVYTMFAEGRDDIAHQLTSTDRRAWHDHGSLDIRQTNGQPISPGPYGTPTVWVEKGNWYLFYERADAGVWLAASADRKVWANVQDQPVLQPGPDGYDQQAVALNQVIKYKGRYYAFYHGTGQQPWKDWCTNVAVSPDLIHWRKYPRNPLIAGDKSSGMVVADGTRFRLYTMHPDVRLYFNGE
ncbi:MAG: glycoside hydrolase family protein [Pirellulaceae bacterium]